MKHLLSTILDVKMDESTSEIDVEIKYENGLREKGVSRTRLIMLPGGGVKRQAI